MLMELMAFSGGSFQNENDWKIDVRGEEKEGKGEVEETAGWRRLWLVCTNQTWTNHIQVCVSTKQLLR